MKTDFTHDRVLSHRWKGVLSYFEALYSPIQIINKYAKMITWRPAQGGQEQRNWP